MNQWRHLGILMAGIGGLWIGCLFGGLLPDALMIFDRELMNMTPGVILVGIGAAWISLGTTRSTVESEQ